MDYLRILNDSPKFEYQKSSYKRDTEERDKITCHKEDKLI